MEVGWQEIERNVHEDGDDLVKKQTKQRVREMWTEVRKQTEDRSEVTSEGVCLCSDRNTQHTIIFEWWEYTHYKPMAGKLTALLSSNIDCKHIIKVMAMSVKWNGPLWENTMEGCWPLINLTDHFRRSKNRFKNDLIWGCSDSCYLSSLNISFITPLFLFQCK